MSYVSSGPMGRGQYLGEIRQGPDGQLYQWVSGIDGLGNPIGFWKPLVKAGKAITRAAGKAGRTALKVISRIPRPPIDVLDPLKPLFDAVVQSNVAVARRIQIPASFPQRLLEYAGHNPSDGEILRAGLRRNPRFYTGGWILKLQPKAGAMTLDRHIFVKEGSFSLSTYIHEMVHVAQYGKVGVSAFLTSYFGMSAFTIVKRWLQRKPVDEMKSSPHEIQAYNIESRFTNWCRNIAQYQVCGYG